MEGPSYNLCTKLQFFLAPLEVAGFSLAGPVNRKYMYLLAHPAVAEQTSILSVGGGHPIYQGMYLEERTGSTRWTR